jgi:uncharacterized membrane protein
MTKEELLQKVSARYDELQSLNKLDNMYEYEKGFEDIWIELGRSVLEANIGTPPKDRRKKKPYSVRRD